jgi:hypothetical protein
MKLLRYGLWIKIKIACYSTDYKKEISWKGANSKDLFVSHFVIVSTLGNFLMYLQGILKINVEGPLHT